MDIGGGGGGIPSPATGDETMARRRSRRVSFAEITAVHVFDRDEDFETPPEERAASPSPSPSLSPGKAAEDGEETDGEEGFLRPPFRFVNDIDSSSPGSAVGSIASNDDEDFFGPVSRSFILSGRPSDSGVSEDGNQDITLDSATFSMHFRNVAPPDDCSVNSAGSLRTPNSASMGPLKELTGSGYGVKLCNSRDALTDMSLFADNPERYDYAKLSPTLDNLLQKVKDNHEPESTKNGVDSVTPDHYSTLAASEKGNREEISYVGNDISCELDIIGSHEEHISISNPVAASTDPIQEGYAMIVDVHEKSQENCNNVQPPAMLSPLYQSLMSNVDSQPNLVDQHLPKDLPPETSHTANAYHLLPSAVPVIPMYNAEQLHQQNQVMDSDAIPHTPKTVVQTLQIPQGSVSSLRSKRQRLFSPLTLSTSNVISLEACSLGSEFVKHSKRITALEDRLKSRLHESPAAHNFRLPLIERNEFGLQPNSIISNTENHGSTISVSSNSVSRRHLKKMGQASILVTPRKELNEATKIQNVSSSVLMMDSQPSHECNSILDLDGDVRKNGINDHGHAEQEHPEKRSKVLRSPITSLKQLPCVSLSSSMTEENQIESHGKQQSVNVDWNKVVLTISNATCQIFSASISKVKPQQLDMLGDMLGEIQMTTKYKRLSTAVMIQVSGNDTQKKLVEARSLLDKLLYEKAKLQINRVKLEKLHNKAQQFQDGIQECCYLKSKISDLCCSTVDATLMKGAPLHATTLITASNRQEGLAMINEKRLALDMIKKKVEISRSSLAHVCNTKGDISCDEVIRAAEEQLEIRNRCRVIHQQAWLWELNDLVKRENKRDIILNYYNLLFQRIILNISDKSGIFVNNSLSGSKIGQTFPNLNASVAFNFVFKAEANQRVSDLRSLQKKTMVS
ncbi:hypothetical protein GUJ93_ZPchr0006g43435 [Zizania palustris]|uniref:Knl1 C-terminal RWD domain-containing protein n=1 Tax=Zizania palustris TaxID=103762 RepID=A0A8J5SIE9_ZIZPA|nr:hypothetical protein GUJ93_ZPchr0006g43435 [Zizania palustris]